MTRLGSAFGDPLALRTKTFSLAGQTFKVRVPLTKEVEAAENRIKDIDPIEAEKRYEKLVSGFDKTVQTEKLVFTEDDVIFDGRSTRDLVRSNLEFEGRVVEYFKFLIPIEGTLDDLTYEEIDAEWPLQVQLDLLAKIAEVISPSYKDERKN